MSKKKYYVLYKVIRDYNDEIIDVEYLNEYERQADILKDYNINFRDVKKMINNNINNYNTLKLHKNYTIIKED